MTGSLTPTPVGGVPAFREPIVTPRLVLEPVSLGLAQALADGDFSSVRPGEDWPRGEDTLRTLRVTLKHGVEVFWLVVRDGVVIGDAHTHGGADESGAIEIGYGLAEPYRGQGYGTELVVGLSTWLLAYPGITRVVANNVEAENLASRRALERAGFTLQQESEGLVSYALA